MGKQRRNPVSDEEIIEHYQVSHSAYKTAEALGVGDTTVHRVLTRHGVPRVGLEEYRRNAGRYRGCEQQIRRDYEAGATYDALQAKYGKGSEWSLKRVIRQAGGILRENPAPLVQPGEVERIRDLNGRGLGQVAISLEIGRSQSFVSRLMRRHGIDPQEAKGPAHSRWKGGRTIDGNGYARVWIADDDPYASMRLSDAYVMEHRLVMARKLKRALLRTETVHHINGDRADNRPENLELRQGKHGKHVVMCCLDCGSRNIGHSPVS